MAKIVNYNLQGELLHGMAVSILAREVSKELGENATRQEELALAGLLHDIGKLRLLEYLYGEGEEEKKDPLVVEEMKYVRMHPQLSFEILKEEGFSDSICETVRCHHENFDGSGYPENLSGYAIPRAARIVRVCDVYAALTTDRPYRKRFTREEALRLMIDEINHFDMEVYLALTKVAHRIGEAYLVQAKDIQWSEQEVKELLGK